MKSHVKGEGGFTLVESMIAMFILLVGLLGLAQVLTFGVIASKAYGRDAGLATAAARSKMEELMGLQFTDSTTNLTTNPPFSAGGTGLTEGGSIYPATSVNGYSDQLDSAGRRTGTPTAAEYLRQWRIVDDSATLKTISVSVRSIKSFRFGVPPSTTLVTHKSP
jgi:prepilin-type N-terminal cleavage/methylation domain-containing protein